MSFDAPELLLFDLDGTLLDSSRTIRPRTIEALTRVREVGVLVGLSTGRSLRSVEPYLTQIEPNGPLVLLNGCQLVDGTSRQTFVSRTIPREDAVAAVLIAAELDIHASAYVDDEIYVARRGEESKANEEKDGVPHTQVGDLGGHLETGDGEVSKLLFIDAGGNRFADLERALSFVLRSDCNVVRSDVDYLELLPPGVNKSFLLHEIDLHYDVAPTKVGAFGDELNDVDLLRVAGHAVVMGNANPAIRSRVPDAHYIGTNDTDAIADFLVDLYRLGPLSR